MGVNLFDTAELYGGGYSEELLGKAISDRRQEVVVCSKFNARNSSKDKLRASLENSLRRLNTDYIDFYLPHWPNPNISIENLIDCLKKFQKEGKIRAYGIGNATFSEIMNFSNKNNNQFFVVENEYNLLEKQAKNDIIPYCERNHCLFMSYSPLLQGKGASYSKVFDKLAVKYDCTGSQLLLSWVFRNKIVSIVRTLNPKHLRDNIRSLKIKISDEDATILEELFKVEKKKIDISQVKIHDKPFSNISDAIRNKIDLIPSPLLLSQRIRNKQKLPPLRTYFKDGYYHIINDYYYSEIKKYWAWKICNIQEIEAYIFNDIS